MTPESNEESDEVSNAWSAWIGRERLAIDMIDVGRVRALQATLDDPCTPLLAGDPLPPLWHWLYFWSLTPMAGLGRDGHSALGEFLPPIDLPRRMWAGSRVTFHRPLTIGAEASRSSVIADVKVKEGRSGPLAFVTLRHEIANGEGVCITEEQDIVYRAAAAPGGDVARPGQPAPAAALWRRKIEPNPVLLFRYSALTFNGHRIHYDQPFATETEGYPGLIVHGPLLATLMIDQVRRVQPEAQVAFFAFRALRPIFDTAPFAVAGQPAADGRRADVWVSDPDGMLAMQGDVVFAV